MPIERQMQRYIVNSEITQYTVYRAHQQLPWFEKEQKKLFKHWVNCLGGLRHCQGSNRGLQQYF